MTAPSPPTEDPQSRLDTLAWPFRTERLTVRRCTAADIEPMWRYRDLPETSQWTTWRPVDLDDWRMLLSKPERLSRTLVFEHNGTIAGDLMLMVQSPWSQREVAEQARHTQAELGWSMDPAFGGQGLATEAVRELIRICFEELGLRRVIAGGFVQNEPTWRLMERVGMRREVYVVRESLHRDLGWLDGIEYALLDDEWRANT